MWPGSCSATSPVGAVRVPAGAARRHRRARGRQRQRRRRQRAADDRARGAALLVMALDVAKGAAAVALASRRRAPAATLAALDRRGRRRRPHLSGVAALPRRQGRGGRGRRVRGADADRDRASRPRCFSSSSGLTRYVSLGSVAATLALPPAAWLTGAPARGRRRRGRHRRADPVPSSRATCAGCAAGTGAAHGRVATRDV